MNLLLFLVPFQLLLQTPQLERETASENRIIYVVRHGESTSNVPDPETGLLLTSGKSLHIPLTEKGKQQARDLGAELAKKLPKGSEIALFSSSAERAKQTAFEMFHVLQDSGFSCELETHGDEGLCELGQGPWEGEPKDTSYQEELGRWEALSPCDKFFTQKVSGGESYEEVADRVSKALQKILDDTPSSKYVFVVSHHGAMNAFFLKLNTTPEELSKDPQEKIPRVGLQNCDFIAVEVPKHGSIHEGKVSTHYQADLQ